MYRSSRVGAASAMMAVLILAACSDANSPDVSASADETAALAAAVGDGTAGDVALMTADVLILDGQATQASSPVPGFAPPLNDRFGGWPRVCPFDSALRRFVCRHAVNGSITMSRSYSFADENGDPQDQYDPLLTASANFMSTIEGTIERPRWSAEFARTRDLTFTGLAGQETERTVNGTGTGTLRAVRYEDSDGERLYEFDANFTISDVVLPVGAAEPWPLSGIASREVVVHRKGPFAEGSRTRTATVTFNGTQFVPLIVNEREFTLDLATGDVTPVS